MPSDDIFQIIATPILPPLFHECADPGPSGAFVEFSGWVRDRHQDKTVTGLDYEAREALCRSEAEKIFAEAREKFGVLHIACIHRTGHLKVGERSVWIGVVAGHRDAAFAGCRYVIDQIKLRLPIWKKEIYADSPSSWVGCRADEIQPPDGQNDV